MKQNIYFSGIQPTGEITIGNYLGAIKQWVDLQTKGIAWYCVVDLHAITIKQDAHVLTQATINTLGLLLAMGIDPKQSNLFVQSQNPHHTELAWYLSTIARIGWLNRMTQFKEKSSKNREGASVGLYTYPVLMAADILLYHTTQVPVGEDQVQHLELTRMIAEKFNFDYHTNLFTMPEAYLFSQGKRIMSLRDGTKKMSKSDSSAMGYISMLDSNDMIATKIKKAKTDSLPWPKSIEALDTRPEIQNLLSMLAILKDHSLTQIFSAYNQFSTLKADLIDALITEITPIREKAKHIIQDPSYIIRVSQQSVHNAMACSEKVLTEFKKIIGVI